MSNTTQGTRPHPSRGPATLLICAGFVFVVLGVAHDGIRLAPLLLGSSSLLLALLLVWLGNAVQLVNAALESSSKGDVAEAARLLDEAERRYGAVVGANIALQRARLSWARPDPQATCMFAGAAIEGGARRRWLSGLLTNRRSVAHLALGLRGLSRAVEGQSEAAKSDISGVKNGHSGRPEPLAYAALAEGVLLQRAGDAPALRRHLARCCWLLLEYLPARERLAAQALWRYAYAPPPSGGTDDTAPEPAAPVEVLDPTQGHTLSDPAWVGLVMPQLRDFVLDSDVSPETSTESPGVRAEVKRKIARQKGRRAPTKPPASASPDARGASDAPNPAASLGQAETPSVAEVNSVRRKVAWRSFAAAIGMAVVLISSFRFAGRSTAGPTLNSSAEKVPTAASAAPSDPSWRDPSSKPLPDPSPSSPSPARPSPARPSPAPSPSPSSPAPSSNALHSPSESNAIGASLSRATAFYPYLLGLAASVLLLVWLISSVRRQSRLSSARLSLAQGELEEAGRTLAALQATRNSLVRAVSLYEIARIADRRGDFEATRALCHEALTLLARARVPSSDRLRSDLAALDTLAQVLLGADPPTVDRAKNVLGTTRQSSQAKDMLVRARLLSHARKADWSAAHEEASTHAPTERVDPRTWILVDAIRAVLMADKTRASALHALLADWELGAVWMKRAIPNLVQKIGELARAR